MKRSRSIFFASLATAGAAVAAAALIMTTSVGQVSAAPTGTDVLHAPHVMGVKGATGHAKPGSTSYLKYQGGSVETTPTVYIDYWGSQWSTGFSTGGYTSGQAQTYVNDFYTNVGGSSWDNIDTQYCQGVATGTINCGTSGTHITNPAGQLAGTWNDTSTVPSSPTQSQIAAEAVNAMNHFGGYNANATYFVFTPTKDSMTGFGTQWCAWHSVTTSGSNQVAYAYMPYIPDAGTSCGMNYVNGSNNSFGNGYFDGFSIVGGHEYAEAMTDPHPSSGSNYGWITSTSNGSENGDLCAWNNNGGTSGNIALGGNSFAVQPIWSNATTTSSGSHCVMSY